MKRIIALFALICILLSGCSAGIPGETGQQSGNFFSQIVESIVGGASKKEKALLELGDGVKEQSVAVVKITVNPEFELYLDGAFCVIKVRCLNEDAVTAFETMQAYDVPVIGLRYEEAMPVILDGIAAAGFLNENTDKIQVDATLLIEFPEEEMSAMGEAISAPVAYYTAENNLNVEVEAPVPNISEDARKIVTPDSVVNGSNGQQSNANMGVPNSELTFTIEENGSEIGEGIRYFDENGSLYRETSSFTDGTTKEVLYYKNGNLKSDITNRPDGCIQQLFREDGTQSYYLENTAEKYYEMTFYPNGNRETETLKQGERSSTSTFYENGNMKSSISDEPDGHFEWHYFEDGREKSYIADKPDDYYECAYYDNGNLAIQTSRDSDGSFSESIYYENGNIKSSIVTDDGEHYEEYYYEDGTVQKSIISLSTGLYQESHYYPSGELAVTVIKDGNDYYYEERYDENGNLTYESFEDPSDE